MHTAIRRRFFKPNMERLGIVGEEEEGEGDSDGGV